MTKEIIESPFKQTRRNDEKDECYSFQGSSPLNKNIDSEAEIQKQVQDYNAQNNQNLNLVRSPIMDSEQNQFSPNFLHNIDDKNIQFQYNNSQYNHVPQEKLINVLENSIKYEPQHQHHSNLLDCKIKLDFDEENPIAKQQNKLQLHQQQMMSVVSHSNEVQQQSIYNISPDLEENQLREKLKKEIEDTVQNSLISIQTQQFEAQHVLQMSQEKKNGSGMNTETFRLISPSQVIWDDKLYKFWEHIASSASSILIQSNQPSETPGKISVTQQVLQQKVVDNLKNLFSRPTMPVGGSKMSVGQFTSNNNNALKDIINRPQCSTVSQIVTSNSTNASKINTLNASSQLFSVSAMSQDIQQPQSVGQIVPLPLKTPSAIFNQKK